MAGAETTAGKALVLFSGGQDSTTCLAWALERYGHVETVGFDYGQRNRIELECRQDVRLEIARHFAVWADRLKEDHLLDLRALSQLSNSALVSGAAIESGPGSLPNTFVPGRNLLFFAYAAALAYGRGIRTLVGGMCETDYSGYPDCRAETLRALQQALSRGMDVTFCIETPLMHVDKAGTWALAEELGGPPLLDIILWSTHTCYLGRRDIRHEWGLGCGTCPACDLRRKGYLRFTKNAQQRS
jgi:7-cyano-7-deazaguanine synthase